MPKNLKSKKKIEPPPFPYKHRLPNHFLQRAITIDVIGCGGNGSQIVNGLAPLHVSLIALGHPYGLEVRVWDPDTVSEFNMGRQLFAPTDIGQFKPVVLLNRINSFYGLSWEAMPTRWKPFWSNHRTSDIVIGCVDTAASRREIHSAFMRGAMGYWLDLGNGAKTGQVVLGESPAAFNERTNPPHKESVEEKAARLATDPFPRMPAVTELFREILTTKKEDNTPSCSMAGALQKQDLFINRHVSSWGLQLLWSFFRQGGLNNHGHFVNLETGTASCLPIDRVTWERLGFFYGYAAPKRKIRRRTKQKTFMDGTLVYLTCGHKQWTKADKWCYCKTCAQEGKTE